MTSGSSLNRAARGSALNLVGSGASAISTFILTIVVTRLSSQAEAGIFFSATSLFLLATSLGQLGTNTGLVYFLSGSRARGELHYAKTYMRTASRPVIVVAIAICLLILLVAEPLGALLSPGHETEFASYLRVMAFFVPCAAVTNLATSASRGMGTMRVTAVLDQITKPLLQLVLVGVVLTVIGPGAVSWAWSAAYLPIAIVAWWWWTKLRNRSALQTDDPSFRPGRAFWRFSAPRALAGVTQMAMQRFDIILVGALAGLPAAAVYGAATRFLSLGQMVSRAISLSIQPLLGESLARTDLKDSGALYQAATSWLILATWPIYLILIIFGQPILSLFGTGYNVGHSALLVLCCAMLLATACGMVDMVLVMAGKSVWNLTNVLIAFAVNLTVDIILIPSHGALGAAIGWAAAIAVGNLLPMAQVAYWFRLHPWGHGSLLAIGTTTLAFLLIPLVIKTAGLDGTGFLAGSLGAGVVVYTIGLATFRKQFQLGVLVRALQSRKKRRTAATVN